MPRRRLSPRLYLDAKRQQWVIRDGANFVRTGCAIGETGKAERMLAEYIARKHQPAPSPVPPVADILHAYLRDKVPEMKSRSAKYNISNLAQWWGDKTLEQVTAANCRAYTATKTQAAACADLEKLAAAIRHWHAEYGPLDKIPRVWKPPKSEPRDRYLTREQAARFLWETRRREHLKRFVMIGLLTGSRSGVIRNLEWSWMTWSAVQCAAERQGRAKRRTSALRPYLCRASSCTSYGAGSEPMPDIPSMWSITMACGSSAMFNPHGGTLRCAPDCLGCIHIS
jgi:integrase